MHYFMLENSRIFEREKTRHFSMHTKSIYGKFVQFVELGRLIGMGIELNGIQATHSSSENQFFQQQ